MFIGKFENNMKVYGEMIYANGDKYVGHFTNNVR